MAHEDRRADNAAVTAVLQPVVKSQYHAALAMLRQTVERCPDVLWSDGNYANPFWRVAYHTLYYVHLYIQPTAADYRPWEHHQTGIQDLDDRPSPPDIQALTELPHRPPQTGEPYTKAQTLEYWELCEQLVDSAVDALDLLSPNSGFSWYRVSKLEHQLVAIRHIQHHTAQLMDRIRSVAHIGIDWVGARRR